MFRSEAYVVRKLRRAFENVHLKCTPAMFTHFVYASNEKVIEKE